MTNKSLLPRHIRIMTGVSRSIYTALALIGVSLLVGILGYHYLGNLSWMDALLEASMILGGEGPIATMETNAVKLFASAYALFSGLMLLSTTGILLAPWLHKLMHHTQQHGRDL